MAYYEKQSSRDIARFTIAFVLLLIAVGSFGYLVTRFGTNPMALRQSITWEEILNPNAQVKLAQPQNRDRGQVAGEKDQAKPSFTVRDMDISSIKKDKNTVEMVRVQNIPVLKYKDIVIAPQSGFDISNLQLDDVNFYPWKAIIAAPAELGDNQIHSFYSSPDTANLAIVIKAGAKGSTNNNYYVYVYNEFDKEVPLRLVHSFPEESSKASVPQVTGMSPDGRFISLGLLTCSDCPGVPSTIVVDSKKGYVDTIGKISLLSWGQGGQYQYKEYKEVDCPDATQTSRCTLDPQYLEFKSGSVLPE
jgi:hypothetical protein